MPKIPLAPLLEPLSGDQPCGPAIDDVVELSTAWLALQTEAKGKPEQQFGDTIIEAKPADWKSIHSGCIDLLKNTHHLEPAVYLLAAAVELDGLIGLRDGLSLVAGYVREFWDTLHPMPDPDDPEDFYEREGVLEMMTLGYQETQSDLFRFVERVRKAPLAAFRELGVVSLHDILATRSGASGAKPAEFLRAVFEKGDQEGIQTNLAAARESAELIGQLDNNLKERLGGSAPSFSTLIREINQVKSAMEEFTSSRPVAETPTASAPVTTAQGGEKTLTAIQTVSTPGTIGSRADVVLAIDAIIRYYQANEPGSPVPFLLSRAKSLVDNDFLSIIRNFRPDLERDFLSILGVSAVTNPGSLPLPPPPEAPRGAPSPVEEPEDPWKSASF